MHDITPSDADPSMTDSAKRTSPHRQGTPELCGFFNENQLFWGKIQKSSKKLKNFRLKLGLYK